MALTVLDSMEYGSDFLSRKNYKTSDVDSSISLLVDFEGENNTNNFIDLSGNCVSFLNSGTPVIKTDQYYYGNSCGYFNGSSYIYSSALPQVNFGTDDFTIHFWMRPTVSWNSQYNSCGIIGQKITDGSHGWCFYKDTYTPNVISFRIDQINIDSNSSPSINTWEHWAVTRSSGTVRWFKNGVLDCTPVTYSNNIYDNSADFRIGKSQIWNGGVCLQAYLDGIVIIKGNALWTDTFTPPSVMPSAFYDNLQSYSESTNIIEGSYSLKGIASQTTSLNKTLTRTISSPINLTGHAYIIGKIRSNRTGSNIKIGFHDSGGTTTEVTPNITSADTWQTIQLDISGVSDVNKDAIDQIIITIVNADADNTFYLDNFFAADATDFGAGTQVSKAVGYAVLMPIEAALNVSKVVGYAVLIPVSESADSGPMIWIF